MAKSTVDWFDVREKYCSLADKLWLISRIRPNEQAENSEMHTKRSQKEERDGISIYHLKRRQISTTKTSHTPSDPILFRSHCTKSCEPSLLTRKKKHSMNHELFFPAIRPSSPSHSRSPHRSHEWQDYRTRGGLQNMQTLQYRRNLTAICTGVMCCDTAGSLEILHALIQHWK